MRRLTTVAVLALALTACGGGDDEAEEGGTTAPETSESSSEAAEPAVPTCSDVWQEGQSLPADYEGCMDGETLVVATFLSCSDGRSLYTYEGVEPNLFAFDTDAIQVGGAADRAYSDAYGECQ